jgi:hypothetical protein
VGDETPQQRVIRLQRELTDAKVVVALRMRRERTQLALLKWGEVATVKTADVASVGTYGELTLHGLPYDDGVILADSRRPNRALCVSSFPYDLERDQSGNWVGQVAPRVITGSVLMIAVLVVWTAAMVVGLGFLAS